MNKDNNSAFLEKKINKWVSTKKIDKRKNEVIIIKLQC